MLNLIGSILKYSLLVVVILVLSHIIEIKGITISQHVDNGLNWIGAVSPKSITRGLSGEIQKDYKKIDALGSEQLARLKNMNMPAVIATPVDAGMTNEDEKELHHVIEQAKRK